MKAENVRVNLEVRMTSSLSLSHTHMFILFIFWSPELTTLFLAVDVFKNQELASPVMQVYEENIRILIESVISSTLIRGTLTEVQ